MNVVCLRCSTVSPAGTEWCPCGAYLPFDGQRVQENPPPGTQPQAVPPGPPGDAAGPPPGAGAGPGAAREEWRAGLVATISDGQVRVEAGGTGTCTVQVRNTGTIVDEYLARPLGPAASFITCEPERVSLFPGAAGTLTVTLAPARSPQQPAGTYPFEVRLESRSDANVSANVAGSVEVGAYQELAAEVRPRSSRGRIRGRHSVSLANQGNALARAAVSARDPEERLRFRVTPPLVQAWPGFSGAARLRVSPRKWRWLGGPDQVHQFEVLVQPEGGGQVMRSDGQFTQRAVLGGGAKFVAAASAGLLIGIAIFHFQGAQLRTIAGNVLANATRSGQSAPTQVASTPDGAASPSAPAGPSPTASPSGPAGPGGAGTTGPSGGSAGPPSIVSAATCAAGTVSTSSPTAAQAVPGLALGVDGGGVARRALVQFSANMGVDLDAEIRLAYSVDGGPAQENVFGPANIANHQQYFETRTATAVIALPAGIHTITPFWRVSGASGKRAFADKRCLTVLATSTTAGASDSIVPAAVCAGGSVGTSSPTPQQAIPGLSVAVNGGTVARRALVQLSGNMGVDQDAEIRLAYSVDGAPVQENAFGPANIANHQQYYETRSATAIVPVGAGTHTITAFWRVSGASGKRAIADTRCLTVLDASSAVPATDPIVPAGVCAGGMVTTSAPAGLQAVPGLSVSVNGGGISRRALVQFSANMGVDVDAEIRLAYSVDGAPAQENAFGPANVANHQQYWETRAATAVIPLPPGAHTITVQWRVSGVAGKNAVADMRCLTVLDAA